ncbi:MAG: hypothetical protein HC924_07115 [Synechococcaceae cyanobacterium SM2_3_2]|nr:hypothetical protein [Synechococcaceae cyanobacterium SM2_3_2]
MIDVTGDRSDYEILQSQVERLFPSQSCLKLTVRMTNGKFFPINFWADSFRLTLGADTLAPSNALNQIVDANSTQTGEVAFTIPNAPANGSLRIRMGDIEGELTLQIC